MERGAEREAGFRPADEAASGEDGEGVRVSRGDASIGEGDDRGAVLGAGAARLREFLGVVGSEPGGGPVEDRDDCLAAIGEEGECLVGSVADTAGIGAEWSVRGIAWCAVDEDAAGVWGDLGGEELQEGVRAAAGRSHPSWTPDSTA